MLKPKKLSLEKKPEKTTSTHRSVQVFLRLKEKVTHILHPKNMAHRGKETLKTGMNISHREWEETLRMIKIYLLYLVKKDGIDENDLRKANKQAQDIVRILILVPTFVAPFGSAIIVALNALAKKVDIDLMPTQTFWENKEGRGDRENKETEEK